MTITPLPPPPLNLRSPVTAERDNAAIEARAQQLREQATSATTPPVDASQLLRSLASAVRYRSDFTMFCNRPGGPRKR
jgi:hypothetical protein